MVDYNVGDTVRRTVGEFGGMYVGDTDRVVAVFPDEVTLEKYGYGHDPAKLTKCAPVFDPDVAVELKERAMQAVAKYNEYLKLYTPPFNPLVVE
jgi:hypothetical protein